MNYESVPLTRRERKAMQESPAVLERVVLSYRMMLDFYGLVLVDLDTGLLARSERYQERYRHLGRMSALSLSVPSLRCGLVRLIPQLPSHLSYSQTPF